MTEEIVATEKINIEDMIYEVRGKQVMLDSDLANLYQCKNGTKSINLAVKRHINRFPERFMFQLTEEEYSKLRFQFETANTNMQRTFPYVFTEQGVAMLATILRTPVAESISIQIMDAFITMKKYISTNLIEQRYINEIVLKDNKRITLLEEAFTKLKNKERKINEIYFNGQIYDAYSKLIDIMSKTEKELIIIDSYVDKSILDMISKIDIPVILITRKNNLLKQIDIDKYNKQYHNLKILYDNTFHDRYLILDHKTIYHCGTSLNHAGNRTFSINVLEDAIVKSSLLNRIDRIKEDK